MFYGLTYVLRIDVAFFAYSPLHFLECSLLQPFENVKKINLS